MYQIIMFTGSMKYLFSLKPTEVKWAYVAERKNVAGGGAATHHYLEGGAATLHLEEAILHPGGTMVATEAVVVVMVEVVDMEEVVAMEVAVDL